MPVFIKNHPSKCLNRVNLVCEIRKPKLLKEVQAMIGKLTEVVICPVLQHPTGCFREQGIQHKD